MQTSKTYMEAANAAVTRLPAQDAIMQHGAEGAIFVDVRDSAAIAKTGTIAGAHHIPRGMLEFMADPETPMYNPALNKDADIYLVCGAGGQAALAGKTMLDMGFTKITNIGGIGDWIKAGGPIDGA